MKNTEDSLLERQLSDLKLAEAVKIYIRQMLAQAPVKTPTGTKGVVVTINSRKFGYTFKITGKRCKLPFITINEIDEATHVLVQDPTVLRLSRNHTNGKKSIHSFFPSFFRITKTAAEFVQCEMEHRLKECSSENASKASDYLYTRSNDGSWRCPSAESAAAALGLGFIVYSSAQIPWQLVRNTDFLYDYYVAPALRLDEDLAQKIRSTVLETPGLRTHEVLNLLKPKQCSDVLYFLIARGELYCDLRNDLLADGTARIYADISTAQKFKFLESRNLPPGQTPRCINLSVGATLTINGVQQRIVKSTSSEVVLSSESGVSSTFETDYLEKCILSGSAEQLTSRQTIAPLPVYDNHQWSVALDHYKQIELFLVKKRGSGPRPNRTQSRYLGAYRTADASGLPAIFGLMPKKRVGNKTPQIEPLVEAIITKVLETEYLTTAAISKEQAWARCVVECETHAPPLQHPPCRKTVYLRISRLDPYEVECRRNGKKAAYEFRPANPDLDPYCEPIDGDWTWSIALIDHTQLDVQTKRGRPWLTLIFLPRHRRVLAYILSYEAPSYRSCMQAIRACVRRFSRLPRLISTDGGKEFISEYFESLALNFNFKLEKRPGAQPRYGTYIERYLGITTSSLVHNILGNTKLSKRVRLLVPTHDPENTTPWELVSLSALLEEYFFELYDTSELTALQGNSPRASYEKDIEKGGERAHRCILYNEGFLIATLPTTKTGKTTIHSREGVRVNKIAYWCREFRDSKLNKTIVSVRFDPYNISYVYILLDDQWVRCISRVYQQKFANLTPTEIAEISIDFLKWIRSDEAHRASINGQIAVLINKHETAAKHPTPEEQPGAESPSNMKGKKPQDMQSEKATHSSETTNKEHLPEESFSFFLTEKPYFDHEPEATTNEPDSSI